MLQKLLQGLEGRLKILKGAADAMSLSTVYDACMSHSPHCRVAGETFRTSGTKPAVTEQEHSRKLLAAESTPLYVYQPFKTCEAPITSVSECSEAASYLRKTARIHVHGRMDTGTDV